MNKKLPFLALAAAVFFMSNAAPESMEIDTVYISPNNDGVKDELVIPLKITDRRYIVSWNLVITDKSGSIVRTIGNKTRLPERLTLKNFFSRLFTPKNAVDVPKEVVWNGALDTGETAPDGDYYYYFTASDDNNNIGYKPDINKEHPMHVVVDNTPPHVDLLQPGMEGRIFGEGAKALFPIEQRGSVEDEWISEIRNVSGDVVMTKKWASSEPMSFSWEGKDDKGNIVPDGVYSYTVFATDRAGNVSNDARIKGIVYSGERPLTSISIAEGKYISPGTQSPLQSVKFIVSIPAPSQESGNRIVDWKIDITDERGKAQVTFAPSSPYDVSNPPSSIVFNGRRDNGAPLPDGEYKARLFASYLNGYTPDVSLSPPFVIDTLPPSASVRVSERIFSPDGDGVKDVITFSQKGEKQSGAPVKMWNGYIVDANNPARIIRQYDFGEYPPEKIAWDGIDGAGHLTRDGQYKYVIAATDLAGNAVRKESDTSFVLDTTKTEVVLAREGDAFSPNGDGIKDKMSFIVIPKTGKSKGDYTFTVRNKANAAVKTIKGSGEVPPMFSWDGRADGGTLCADGAYQTELSVVSENGSKAKALTLPFELDTKPPYLALSSSYLSFSPDGKSARQTLPLSVSNCTHEDVWTAKVSDSSGQTVRTYSWQDTVPPSVEWDGKDDAGNTAPDGVYTLAFSSEDMAGNVFSTSIEHIALDTREAKAFVASEHDGISPNGDGILDSQRFALRSSPADGISSWMFYIADEDGKVVQNWTGDERAATPVEIQWDGRDGNGRIAEGVFTGCLAVTYENGNSASAQSHPFICSVTPPALFVGTSPEYFSPDNDGVDDEEIIALSYNSVSPLKSWSFVIDDPQNDRAFWNTSGASSITERIIWDGASNTLKGKDGKAERVESAMDYPYTFTATDTLGMTSRVSGVIGVDILVIRDGDLLKMAVPSIIFRADYADFKTTDEVGKGGLDKAKAKNNERILDRVAQILGKFKDYKVTIVGHANRTTEDEAEETQSNSNLWGPALIPLSQDRASFVRECLILRGVSGSRLSTEGKGGTVPVADWQDKNNNWKNRRVEFILVKR